MSKSNAMYYIRQALLWIGGFTLLIVILAALAGMFYQKTQPGKVARPEAPAPEFQDTARVTARVEQVIEQAPGTLTAVREAMISSRIMAVISEITFSAGDSVQKGQLLVRLESRDLEARVAQARESLNAAQARLADAEKEYERMQKLFDQNIVPRSQLDTAEANYIANQAEVERAQQALQEARASLAYALLEAPFAGRVVDRFLEPGDMATPGQPILKIYDPQQMRIEAYVRETLIGRLTPGQELPVRIDALDVRLTGFIEEVVPQAEPGSRSVRVKVGLPERPDLYPGMFGRIVMETGQTRRIYVPQQAIQRVGQLQYVWMIESDGRPFRRFIKPGDHTHGNRIEVLSGLAEGETVGVPIA